MKTKTMNIDGKVSAMSGTTRIKVVAVLAVMLVGLIGSAIWLTVWFPGPRPSGAEWIGLLAASKVGAAALGVLAAKVADAIEIVVRS